MALFAELDTKGVERSEDTLGGNFNLFDSDIYEAKIKAAYGGASRAGALNVTVVCDIKGQEYSETIYITNRDKLPYTDKSGKRRFLPGYNIMNSICKIATGKGLTELESEEKTLLVFDPADKKQKPTEVPVLTDLSGKTICLGILKELRNKAVQDDQGQYVDTPETREDNRINAVFDVDTHRTLNEIEDNKEAVFWDKWLEKNKGKTVNRCTYKEGDKPPFSTSKSVEQKPRTSLFDKR